MEINTGYLKTASGNSSQKSEHSEGTRDSIFQEAGKKLIGKIVRYRLFLGCKSCCCFWRVSAWAQDSPCGSLCMAVH